MVTTRSRSNSISTRPNDTSSPATTKRRGRPRKTVPSSSDSLDVVKNEEIREEKLDENPIDQKEHIDDSGSRKRTRSLLKRQTKEQVQLLRMKATGMGIAFPESSGTSVVTEPTKRKIVFDDNYDSKDVVMDDRHIDNEAAVDDEIEKDMDDDVVEEVLGSQAKDQIRVEAEQIRAAHRATFTQKKKPKTVKCHKKDTDFDDDFFQQLEQEHVQSKQRKKLKARIMEDETAQRPRHTTFVVHGDDSTEDHMVEHPHNIQVVVLSKEHSASEPASDMVHLYSRFGCIDQIIEVNEETYEKGLKTKKNTKPTASVATWSRSNKMKHVLAISSRARRKGQAAIHFAKQSKR